MDSQERARSTSDGRTAEHVGPHGAVPDWLDRYVTHAPRAVAVVAGDRHRVVVANAGFRDLVVHAARPLVGREVTALPPLGGEHALSALLHRARRTGAPSHGVVRAAPAGDGSGDDHERARLWECVVWPAADAPARGDAAAAELLLVVEVSAADDARRAAALHRDLAERATVSALREIQLAEEAEQARAAAERRAAELAAVIESMPDTVYIGTRAQITLANRAAFTHLGIAAPEPLDPRAALPDAKARPRDAASGAAIAADRHPFVRALAGEMVVAELLVEDQQSGEDRTVRSAAVPVVVDDRVVAAVVVGTDVTEYQRAQAALADARQSLELALAAAEMGVWDVDLGTGAARTSPRHDQAFGQSTPVPVWDREAFRRYVVPDDWARIDEALARATATGAYELEVRVVLPDGGVRWVQSRGRVYRDEAGRPARMAGVTRDCTDVREAQEALRFADERTHAEMEARIAERTAELAQTNAALAAEVDARTRGATERDALRRQLARAEEDERRRLARELHDQLGQHLTGITLGLTEARALARRVDDPDAARLDDRLAALQTLAAAITRDARSLALELRPAELDDLGLESALETYVARWGARYGVAADVTCTGLAERPLPGDLASTLYRIVQEALTNVARHASARQVSVIVEKLDGEVRLIVEDDGCGFDVGATVARAGAEQRLGLAGMRERATLAGGTLGVESTPGQGTTLYVRVPVHRERDRQPDRAVTAGPGPARADPSGRAP